MTSRLLSRRKSKSKNYKISIADCRIRTYEGFPDRFQVCRLNHSAKSATYQLMIYIIVQRILIWVYYLYLQSYPSYYDLFEHFWCNWDVRVFGYHIYHEYFVLSNSIRIK